MKPEGRTAALIALLALGVIGCGGGGGSSQAPAGPGGTTPMPPGDGPPPSTLQAQLAACPNGLILGDDVPCLIGTYEGVTMDTGAACAFVYDDDGMAIYATGTK